MTGQAIDSIFRRKLILAGVLAVLAVVLFLINASDSIPDQRAIIYKGDIQTISLVVDTVLARYGIDKGAIRTRQVKSPDKKFLRVERRVEVPPEFVNVNFNRELSERLMGIGLHLVATERTKENTVTMHVKKDETILESITFVVVSKVKSK